MLTGTASWFERREQYIDQGLHAMANSNLSPSDMVRVVAEPCIACMQGDLERFGNAAWHRRCQSGCTWTDTKSQVRGLGAQLACRWQLAGMHGPNVHVLLVDGTHVLTASSFHAWCMGATLMHCPCTMQAHTCVQVGQCTRRTLQWMHVLQQQLKADANCMAVGRGQHAMLCLR
jgi:hypothetical protein